MSYAIGYELIMITKAYIDKYTLHKFIHMYSHTKKIERIANLESLSTIS